VRDRRRKGERKKELISRSGPTTKEKENERRRRVAGRLSLEMASATELNHHFFFKDG
jgi:hypothetical protein